MWVHGHLWYTNGGMHLLNKWNPLEVSRSCNEDQSSVTRMRQPFFRAFFGGFLGHLVYDGHCDHFYGLDSHETTHHSTDN